MFDISWSEFLLIGAVALIVIGPKELPAVMRTLGQWTRKVRSMAADFQNQFNEAVREAEMADLKKQVDDIAHDVSKFDPLQGVRDDFESAGKDVERSLKSAAEQKPAVPAAELAVTEIAAAPEPPSLPAPQSVESVPSAESVPAAPAELPRDEFGTEDKPADAAAEASAPDSLAKVADGDGAGRKE